MADSNKVPWRAIHEYLLEVGSAKTKQEFLFTALTRMDRMIPADACTGLFNDEGRLLLSEGVAESDVGLFNSYYRFRFPFVPKPEKFSDAWIERAGLEGCARIDWLRFEKYEYVADYAKPLGEHRTLVFCARKLPLLLARTRSRRGPGFSETDCAILSIVTPHLANFYSCFERMSKSAWPILDADEVRDRFPALSRREAEVASLLCQGLTAPEVASRLFIGRRTAETHITHIYQKLNARSKREAVRLVSQVAMEF